MLKKIIYSIHRVLGAALSVMFLVWFLSGFVMIFHSFPKVTDADRQARMEAVEGVMPPLDSIIRESGVGEAIDHLTLRSSGGYPYFEISSAGKVRRILANPSHRLADTPTYEQIENHAKKWSDGPIDRVDTLRELEQWIPFGRLRADFPIYKFYFGDDEKHRLYISSVTGEVLQFTDKTSRFWAWAGAIPHWVYFTGLRQNSELWINVVVWLSGLGSIMCLAGIVLGTRACILRRRKTGKWQTPYKKFAYKWHHITGFIFGIFVFTYVFSGMMSLATVPRWMVRVHNPDIRKQLSVTPPVVLSDYKTDYRKVLEMYGGRVKSLEWLYFGEVPLYKVAVDGKSVVLDASSNPGRPFVATERMILDRLSAIHSEPIAITLIEDYDNYYVSNKRNELPLPVYRADVADADNSTYYINPRDGKIGYFNTNTKVRRWAYQVLHSWELGFLVRRPVLWNIVMWVTMIGGTLVSITGVWLGTRFIRRRIRPK